MDNVIQRLNGSLKQINSNLTFNVTIEFEYDEYGGIRNGKILNYENNHKKGYYCFKSEYTVLLLYIAKKIIIPDNINYFRTIRYKGVNYGDSKNKFVYFINETDLIHGQKFSVSKIEYSLIHYINCCAIEIDNINKLNSDIFQETKKVVKNILCYIQLIQLKHCKIFGYSFNDFMYIDYQKEKFKSFKYNRLTVFQSEEAEKFISHLINCSSIFEIEKIIYHLITARNSEIIEIRYIALIIALEQILKTLDKNKENKYKYFNKLIDDLFPESDLIKIKIPIINKKKEVIGAYWKSILWIYRDVFVHSIQCFDDLRDKPYESEKILLEKNIFMKRNDRILLNELNKCIIIAKKLICILVGLDYEKDLFKIDI